MSLERLLAGDSLPGCGVEQADHGMLGRSGFTGGGDDGEGMSRVESNKLESVTVELLGLCGERGGLAKGVGRRTGKRTSGQRVEPSSCSSNGG